MSPPLLGLAGFGVTLLLILLRVPVAVAMGLTGVAGFALLNGWPGAAFTLGSAPFESVFPYSLSVVPLFVAMGVFAARAGLSQSLYGAVNAFVGHRRGGLAMATIGACALFGAICGSSLATAATMGQVALPEMRRHGYDDRLASAAIAAGGTLGVLIPPSILLVLYGLLTETSIGALFVGALIPGLVSTLLYMAAVVVQTRRHPELGPAGERQSWRRRGRAVARIWEVALLFALVIGGIYFGLFSPTEAAAVGAAGAFLFALLGRGEGRRNRARDLLGAAFETARTTGMIFLILVGAGLFNYFVETSNLPQLLVGWAQAAGLPAFAVLLLVMLFYLVLGCFMDALSMILLTIPFIFPLIQALGFDAVWFGILVVTVAEIGLITPPVGMNLFVIQGVVPGLRQETIVRGILPFLVADLVRLVLLLLIPALVLFLPGQMGH
ncbi:TRAP transporter, DctM subunit [Tistlia consotensis]|uniref:TRAP transporter large permease protein n=1 Tax=Tistlia consotensis USBA 355 TaxID=560819 RepID=A0A1Y6BNU8_9PROT|nr:TRAP transporter large permease [Tistlia consotensis]SMF13360.1 TRAP transporter, DctM subunit [Tistlia consotensis USBA 355]SNR50549.1 TRAP transporter, DctM subunit [Tistlia consotensis]